MQYVALEWDHTIGKPMISWLVVECAGVGEKCGGPQALAPRRDIAYFVYPETAEEDAKEFAEYKNVMAGNLDSSKIIQYRELIESKTSLNRHVAFEWDHHIFNPLIQWAVLQWGGEGTFGVPREDIGYFLDPDTAKTDAKIVSILRDRRIQVPRAKVLQLSGMYKS